MMRAWTRQTSGATATSSSTGSPTTSSTPNATRSCRASSPATSRAALPAARARRRASRSTRSWPTSSACSCPASRTGTIPGFFAYFAITGSAPGVLAEFLSAALNQQAMLWRTSPAVDRARGGGARLAAPADRPARDVRRRHLRHGVDLDPARAARRARGGGRPTSACAGLAGRRRPAARCASTAPSRRTRRSTRP